MIILIIYQVYGRTIISLLLPHCHSENCPDDDAPVSRPHHTISDVGVIGGGQVPRPGEGSLAHHGVRFWDERPECRRHVLEVLRQPLEEGVPEKLPRGRPESLCVCGLSRPADERERLGSGTIAPVMVGEVTTLS
jgi:hypothetical protein